SDGNQTNPSAARSRPRCRKKPKDEEPPKHPPPPPGNANASFGTFQRFNSFRTIPASVSAMAVYCQFPATLYHIMSDKQSDEIRWLATVRDWPCTCIANSRPTRQSHLQRPLPRYQRRNTPELRLFH